ncbi:glycosyltransferase family 4 protein [Oryzobacter sp. R7]|uniref:glycosyltransferase family 4 protein n=1 Tax=Oryzobacter faecalis TaxID=3388656 RepID=UPI00398CC9CC
MRIGFLTPWSLDDPDSWSGILTPMVAALRREAEVVHVPVPDVPHHLLDRAATRALGALRRGYLPGHGLATSRATGPAVAEAVAAARVDVVLSVAASSTLAFADLDVPVVEVSDATFRLLVGYYPLFSSLSAPARWQGEALGRRTARRAAGFLLASDWAAASLVDDYGVDPSRVRVSPFGPSVVATEPSRGPWPGEPLRVLFVGSDWTRKGGDVALEVVARLRDRGVRNVLTVVGDAPGLPSGVRRVGRVRRSRMRELYAAHDVLLEPARANAGGVTLTDATASGLPVVAARTGGVPSIVEDGVTGFLVDPDDLVAGSVDALARLTDHERWRTMARASRDRGATVLSWATWAGAARELCDEVRVSR